MTISHPDIWNHRCQATNLAGSSEQTTPVTVRHAGGSNVQWPMSKVRCQFQCQSKKSWFQNVKESISKISLPRSSNGQLQCRACWWFIVLQLWSDLPGFFKTIFLRKSLRDWSILQIYHNFDWSHMIALKQLLCLHGFCFTVTAYHAAARCPIDNYCLNGGNCAYYKSIGELVCR